METYVDSDPSNANPFLHNLQPDHQLYPPTRVQLPAPDPKEHGEIAITPRRLPLVLNHILDIMKLRLRPKRIYL